MPYNTNNHQYHTIAKHFQSLDTEGRIDFVRDFPSLFPECGPDVMDYVMDTQRAKCKVRWYEFNFHRVFLAWCITMLVLLAFMLENLPAGAMIACAGLS